MIGLILAAGVGSRLRPMTNTKPKCLVRTAGKAILQYQLDSYKKAGITDIFIVVGYEGEAIRQYCKHIKDMNITIVENVDYETTNNMYSLYLLKDIAKGNPFILNNADLSVDVDIVKTLLEFPNANAVAVDTSLFNDESMKVVVQDEVIVDISKKITHDKSFACSIDFYKFSAESSSIFFSEIIRIIEGENNLKDWTEVAMQRLFQSGRLQFKPCDIAGKEWVEIDNYEDLALSDRKFSAIDKELSKIEAVFLDLDGTIYVGSQVIVGVAQAIDKLRQSGKKIYFLSNNSSKSKNDYIKRLALYGISAALEDIILSTDGVLRYLKAADVENVYVLGTNSLKKTFIDNGFNIDGFSPEYVVLGYDTEITYQKLVAACKFINDGVDILATHCDDFCPSEYGPIPDIGAITEMIRITTGRSPKKVFGKPNKEMLSEFLRDNNIAPETALIVGDRLHTDIRLAHELGAKSLLVLSGETKRDQLEESQYAPNYVLGSLATIYG